MINLKTVRRGWWLALLSLALSLGRLGAGEDGTVSEYQVKAAFLYNFTKFVDWPARTFTTTNAPFVIGIVGDNPFNTDLDDVVRDEKVHGHPLVVKRFQVAEDFTGCQLLFVSRSVKEQLGSVLRRTAGRPVLTISDTAGFVEQGVMANLLLVKGSIKMEVNRKVAEAAGLQISAKLLGLARIVESNPGSSAP
jgi:hypothetical protein